MLADTLLYGQTGFDTCLEQCALLLLAHQAHKLICQLQVHVSSQYRLQCPLPIIVMLAMLLVSDMLHLQMWPITCSDQPNRWLCSSLEIG